MADTYRIVAKGGELHLEEAGMFGSDLGELHKTFGGKLETRHLISGNYVLEDVSGMFSSGQKYKMIKPGGEVGYLKKQAFSSDTYTYEPE
jgi:hypothetical protein